MSKKRAAANDLPQDVESLASLLAEQRSALVDNVASIRQIADPAVIREAAQSDAASTKQGFLGKVPQRSITGSVVSDGDAAEAQDQKQFMVVAGVVVAVVAVVVMLTKRRKSRKQELAAEELLESLVD